MVTDHKNLICKPTLTFVSLTVSHMLLQKQLVFLSTPTKCIRLLSLNHYDHTHATVATKVKL